MKIRIKGNSVRIRLSKSEVDKLTETKYLEEQTAFDSMNTFVYALQSKPDLNELSAAFEGNKMTVFMPESFLNGWAENEVIGLESRKPVNEKDSLYLLVEKDFKCLDDVTEDQSDNYDNPSKVC